MTKVGKLLKYISGGILLYMYNYLLDHKNNKMYECQNPKCMQTRLRWITQDWQSYADIVKKKGVAKKIEAKYLK